MGCSLFFRGVVAENELAAMTMMMRDGAERKRHQQ